MLQYVLPLTQLCRPYQKWTHHEVTSPFFRAIKGIQYLNIFKATQAYWSIFFNKNQSFGGFIRFSMLICTLLL